MMNRVPDAVQRVFALLRRAGTLLMQGLCKQAGPGLSSAPRREERRHSASKTRANALMAQHPGNVETL
jgi:hypothetical protein